MYFFRECDCRRTTLANGTILTLQAHDENMTTLGSFLPAGVIKPSHSHPEAQIYLVISGRMRVTIGNETMVLSAGDTAIVPGNVSHVTEVLEDTMEIEVFSPARPELVRRYFP